MILLKLLVFLLPVLRIASWEKVKDNVLILGAVSKEVRLDDREQGPCRISAVHSNKPVNTKALIQQYELDLNASKVQQKDDRKQMMNWTDEYQIKRLDITMKYRLQMIRHQEHSLKSNGNGEWNHCLFVHNKEIRWSTRFYHEHEHECLRTATSKDTETKEYVEQIEKQIAQWRKGYRYLKNLCNDEHVGHKKKSQQCLVSYMQNDRFSEVIQRLMQLKQGAMADLQSYFHTTLTDLEECLRSLLSRYLDSIRSLMQLLSKCYDYKT